jgi:hypothetical protein
LKLDQETAESLMRLAHNRDFQKFGEWLDAISAVFSQGAIMGHDEHNNSDVLRGRAQGLSILKHEMEKAPDVAGRIQQIS